MGFGLPSMQAIGKGVVITAIALLILGFVKVALPDIWAKIPGLKEF